MTKYVLKKEVGYWDDDYPLILNQLVVDEFPYEATGVLTPEGDMIYRAPRPIGFGRDEDW